MFFRLYLARALMESLRYDICLTVSDSLFPLSIRAASTRYRVRLLTPFRPAPLLPVSSKIYNGRLNLCNDLLAESAGFQFLD